MQLNVQQELNRLNAIERMILKRNLIYILTRALAVIKPKPDISRIEFAEKYIVLPDTFPYPGPFRISKSPHLAPIFRALDDPLVRKITIMGCSQFGKTLLMIVDWAYNVVYDPCYMLIQQPTKDLTKSFVNSKLDPVIESSPALRKLISQRKKGRASESTNFYKVYPGGVTEILTAGAKGTGRQRSARRVYSDDSDAIEIDKNTEGDPQENLEARTIAFKYDSFAMNISVPGKEESSGISRDFDISSQGELVIQCPACGTEQQFEDDNLDWDKEMDMFKTVTKNYPATAYMKCANTDCEHTFKEKERLELLQTSDYRHKFPERYHPHAGFHLNQMMSTLSSLKYCVERKIDAETEQNKGNDQKEETRVNQVLGLPYKKIKTKEVDAKALIDIREDYITLEDRRIPNGVLAITHGVDVQAGSGSKPARLELEFWGWGKYEEGWILDKMVFPGNPELQSTWNSLRKYVKDKTFTRKDGIKLGCIRGGYDSGYKADEVYKYCARRFRSEGLVATKGSNKYGAPLVPKKYTRVNENRTVLMGLGTQAAKEILFGRLDAMTKKGEDGLRLLRPGPKYIHLTKIFCDAEYYDQLTAEHGVKKYINGQEYVIYQPKKKGLANEALDLFVINYCMMRSRNPNWTALEKNINSKIETSSNQGPGQKPDKEEKATGLNLRKSDEAFGKEENSEAVKQKPTPTKKKKVRRPRGNNFVKTW